MNESSIPKTPERSMQKQKLGSDGDKNGFGRSQFMLKCMHFTTRKSSCCMLKNGQWSIDLPSEGDRERKNKLM